MRKNTFSLLIVALFFTSFSQAIEKDLAIGECNYSQEASNNLRVSVQENSKCLKEALEKETAQNKINKQTFGAVSEKLKSSYDTIKPYMAVLFLILILYKLIQFLSSENRDRAKKEQSNLLFKASIFSLFVMILSEAEIIEDVSNKGLIIIYHNVILPFAVNNHINEQSDAVKQHAVEANRTIIADKVIEISKSMFESEICAISYKTNLMSSYSVNDFEDEEYLKTNPLLNCLEDYKSDNSSKSLAQLDNRMLSSASINHCSQVSSSSHLIDCGKQYSLGSSVDIDNVLNKYSVEIAKLANEFHSVNCSSLETTDKNNYETYCRNFENGIIKLIETDKTLSDFDTNFSTTIENFVSEFSTILKNEMELEDSQKIIPETKMTSMFDQALASMTVKNRDNEYSSIIADRVNELQSIDPQRRDFESGRFLDTDITDLKVIESVDDYFLYLNNSSLQYFEDANSYVSNLLRQFTWIEDPKLLIGKYNNSSKQDYEIHSDVLMSIQENKVSLLTFGTITKVSVGLAKRSFKRQGKSIGKLETIDTLGSIAIFLSLYKEILTVIFLSLGYALFLPTVITALIMICIKVLSSLFLKIDLIYLGDEINDLYFNIQNISLSLLIPIVGTSLFANVVQHLIENIDVFNEGYKSVLAILNITTYLVICVLLLVVQFILMFWTYNFLNSKQESKSENIKDNAQTFSKKARKIIRL